MIDVAQLTPAHWVVIRVVEAHNAAAAVGDIDAALDAIEVLCIIRGDIPERYSPNGQPRLEQLLEKITQRQHWTDYGPPQR